MHSDLLYGNTIRSRQRHSQALASRKKCTIRMLGYLAFFGMALTTTATHAQAFFETSKRPGGIAVVDLGPVSDKPVLAQWNNRPVAVINENSRNLAVVGIPLSVEPGEQVLSVLDTNGEKKSVSFTVNSHAYAEQRLTITNKRKVNPEPLDMVRITAENKRLKVVKSSRAERLMTDTFIWPVAGPVSSPFGLRRFFNDQPRRPHGGIDIAAPEGTPIVAAADGVVLEADDYFFNGNSVFIEHGLGLQTFYAHMSRIDVANGDRVTQGQVIGTVGETGRVTGPHLHWSVGLNGTWVDPLLVIDTDQPPELPAEK
ncbi:MAG: peptidoglycan DD-metalloendopeptidase family protein [Granulosicoccus sp.]